MGGATLVLFPVFWLVSAAMGVDSAVYTTSFVFFYAAFVINDPHFAVTYVLFYKDAKKRALGDVFAPAQRVRYILSGFVAPVVLVVWALVALSQTSAHALGLMIQLMFLLVGWHYVKQGFGVLTVLCARSSVFFTNNERRVFMAHALTGWAYAWSSPADPGQLFEERGVIFKSLPHPPGLEAVTGVVFAASTVLLIVMLALRSRRGQPFPPLAPLTGFLAAIWLWTVYSGVDPLMMYAIPALHSLQYLYFVWLMKRNQARESEGPPLFGRPVAVRLGILAVTSLALGWLLFRGGPDLMDATLHSPPVDENGPPQQLGATPYAAALITIVNLHHYFMDHVIWRRDNPETRFLRSAA